MTDDLEDRPGVIVHGTDDIEVINQIFIPAVTDIPLRDRIAATILRQLILEADWYNHNWDNDAEKERPWLGIEAGGVRLSEAERDYLRPIFAERAAWWAHYDEQDLEEQERLITELHDPSLRSPHPTPESDATD